MNLTYLNRKKIPIMALALLLGNTLYADISGIVYTDFNLNGSRDFNDVLLKGISVHAVCEDGSTHNTVTDNNGHYTIDGFPSGKYCRIEANPISKGLHAASNDAGSAPLVDRVADGTTDHDISVASPGTYCQATPDILAVAMPTIAEDGSSTYYPDNYPTLLKTSQPSIGSINGQNTIDANRETRTIYDTTGATWGLAYKRDTHDTFVAASLKPYAKLGTGGVGAIYKVTQNNTLSLFTTIPNASSSALNTYLSSRDINFDDSDIYQYIAREGLGDIEMSEDYQTLYALNIYQRSLVAINANTGSIIKTISLPNPYNTSCPNADVRSWALAVKGSDVYIGSVCESKISNSDGGLGASIQKYNGAIVQEVARTNTLDYLKPYYKNPTQPANGNFNHRSWQENKTAPILTDIEFSNNNDLILGYTNRLSFIRHGGNEKLIILGGDIRKMCYNNNGSYTDESTAATPTLCSSHSISYSGNTEIYHEFYVGDYIGDNYGENGHPETMGGALVQQAGKAYITTSMIDGTTFEGPGSIAQLSHISGEKIGVQALLKSLATDTDEANVYGRKAGGLGDIELMCDPAPIEIGNYIWLDKDEDGIQDPNETPLDNIEVQLYDGNTRIGSTHTNTTGHYYFGGLSNANLNSGIRLTPYHNYTIKVRKNQDHITEATIKDAHGNAEDIRDSDARTETNFLVIDIRTNAYNDHTRDIGIIPGKFDLALIQKVNTTLSPAPYKAGEDVTFKITVCNQGTINATNIQIADYIPAGLQLHDNDWIASGNSAHLKTPISSLTKGTCTNVDITFTIQSSAECKEIINNAEICSANGGTDVDSVPCSENGSTPDPQDNDMANTTGGDDYDSEAIGVACSVTPTPTPHPTGTPTPTPTPNPTVQPKQPTHLKATTVDDYTVTLSWKDTSNNESGFRIYDKNYHLIATLPANSTSYTLTLLQANTNYTFIIKAFNAGPESTPAIISFTTSGNYAWLIPIYHVILN